MIIIGGTGLQKVSKSRGWGVELKICSLSTKKTKKGVSAQVARNAGLRPWQGMPVGVTGRNGMARKKGESHVTKLWSECPAQPWLPTATRPWAVWWWCRSGCPRPGPASEPGAGRDFRRAARWARSLALRTTPTRILLTRHCQNRDRPWVDVTFPVGLRVFQAGLPVGLLRGRGSRTLKGHALHRSQKEDLWLTCWQTVFLPLRLAKPPGRRTRG